MPQGDAGASDTSTDGVQETQEVSSQEQPARPNLVNPPLEVEGDTVPDSKEDKSDDSVSDDKNPEESKKKDEPYHKTAAHQRQQRRIRKQNADIAKRDGQIDKLLEKVDQLTAVQKGEEYKPSEKDKAKTPDYQEMLDNELDDLSAKENLSNDDEVAILEIAEKYAFKNGDNKIPLSANQAYAILKDRRGEKPKEEGGSDTPKDEGKHSPNTRPSKKTAEVDKVKIHGRQQGKDNRSLDQIVYEAKHRIRREEAANRQ